MMTVMIGNDCRYKCYVCTGSQTLDVKLQASTAVRPAGIEADKKSLDQHLRNRPPATNRVAIET